MRTKFFLLVCFFIGIGLTQLFAQNGKSNQNRTLVYDYVPPVDYEVIIDVYCDGNLSDQLSVIGFTLGARDHFDKAGVNTWGIYSMKNIAFKSTWTIEVFAVHGFLEKDNWEQGYGEMHMNLIGSLGNHYILTTTYKIDNYVTSDFEYRSNCH